MKSFTLKAGRYMVADGCQSEKYDDVILDVFIDFDGGESAMAGEAVVYCTGSDGLAGFETYAKKELGVIGIDAANVSVFPAEDAVANAKGHFVEFADDFEVVAYHDALVIGGKYRVTL